MNNKLIEETYKLQIIFEKPPNSNPYYASNYSLKECSKLIAHTFTPPYKDKIRLMEFAGGHRNELGYDAHIVFKITCGRPGINRIIEEFTGEIDQYFKENQLVRYVKSGGCINEQ